MRKPSAFKILATDPLALAVIRSWIIVAGASGVSKEKLVIAEAHFEKIKKYQQKHGTKKPD
jgi:hypothetical protein